MLQNDGSSRRLLSCYETNVDGVVELPVGSPALLGLRAFGSLAHSVELEKPPAFLWICWDLLSTLNFSQSSQLYSVVSALLSSTSANFQLI